MNMMIPSVDVKFDEKMFFFICYLIQLVIEKRATSIEREHIVIAFQKSQKTILYTKKGLGGVEERDRSIAILGRIVIDSNRADKFISNLKWGSDLKQEIESLLEDVNSVYLQRLSLSLEGKSSKEPIRITGEWFERFVKLEEEPKSSWFKRLIKKIFY